MDPAVRPYVTYGLSEAQRLYESGGPQYYPGQTYVGPSASTQAGLQAAQTRALQGSALTPAAQQQALGTIGGAYLGGSPFFEGAFQPAARAAQQSFMDSISGIRSGAVQAGRYGSGAMADLENRAMGTLGQSLSDIAGKLAYQNYEAERARQQAMIGAAPGLAEADYGDIQRLLTVGQAQESLSGSSLARRNQPFQLPAKPSVFTASAVSWLPLMDLRWVVLRQAWFRHIQTRMQMYWVVLLLVMLLLLKEVGTAYGALGGALLGGLL
jgi:hypothetical protein